MNHILPKNCYFYGVKFFVTTFLSFLLLLQSSGPVADLCCELLKLPNLIEHYKECTAGAELSFEDFLDAQYGDRSELPEHDDKHDGKLPLQGHHHSCSHGITVLNSEIFEFTTIEFIEAPRASIFYQAPFSSASLGGIFQPPQV